MGLHPIQPALCCYWQGQLAAPAADHAFSKSQHALAARASAGAFSSGLADVLHPIDCGMGWAMLPRQPGGLSADNPRQQPAHAKLSDLATHLALRMPAVVS